MVFLIVLFHKTASFVSFFTSKGYSLVLRKKNQVFVKNASLTKTWFFCVAQGMGPSKK